MLCCYRLPHQSVLATTTILLAFAGLAKAEIYSQNFDGFADGTTNLGDGTVMFGTAQVVGGALQLTQDGIAGGFASFSVPPLANASTGWSATFDLSIFDGPGANEPADGMSFNWGSAPLGDQGQAEEGMTGRNVANNISFEIDTWKNLDAEQGVNISEIVNGADTNLVFTNGSILNDGTTVSGQVEISWDPVTGASFTTTGLLTNAAFEGVATSLVGDDAFTFIISGRVGGANETKTIDNLVINTTPSVDTDNDGLPDNWEDKYGLDPNDNGLVDIDNGPDGDPDEDGVNNEDEYANRTNPIDADTDDDGLGDGAETNTGVFVSASDTGTDPRDADSDGDGLDDGVETNTGVFVDEEDTGTDPHVVDTDEDGAGDGTEIDNGTNPLDDNDTPGLWLVRNAQSGSALNSIANTRALFDGLGNLVNEVTSAHLTINFRENANGPFPNPEAFPLLGIQNGDTNDFAIKATGTIYISQPGTYTFGFNSDDGGGLWIDGNPVVIADVNRGSTTSLGAVDLAFGTYEMEFLYWERGGGAQVQLFAHNQVGDFSGVGFNVGDYHLLETSTGGTEDTDGDLLVDAWETNFFNDLAQGFDDDPDNDGLSNGDEQQLGTDPTKEDSDADGLADGVEDGTGVFVSSDQTGSDPRRADSDGDGLKDGEEITAATDPNNADSDGDGFADGFEVAEGSDPNNPQSTPEVAVVTIIGGLIGGDLTDPENDGIEGPTIPGPPQSAGTNFNWLSISASSENYFGNFGGSEGAYDIFDNMVGGGQAKWCCNGPPQNATVEFEEPVSLTHFTITSGNDTPDRDPRDWQIQGSNDGINFVPIFVRASDEVVWTARDQTVRVDLPSASDAYKYIRYEVTRTNNANHQINEIEYFGEPGGGTPFEVTEINYDLATGEISLTWTSRENKTYAVFFSDDLENFDADVDDSVLSGGDTTTFSFSNPVPGAKKLFFKVTEN